MEFNLFPLTYLLNRTQDVFKLTSPLIVMASGLSVLQSAIGLLVDKGRDWAAKKLVEGDVTDDTFRKLIVRDTDEITRKLDGLARTKLNTSISNFRLGAVFLFKLMNNKTDGQDGSKTAKYGVAVEEKYSEDISQSPADVANVLRKWKFTDLSMSDSDKRKFETAKEGFKDARKEATEAFNNEALSTCDRIRAMAIRVAATILEKIDDPEDALEKCRTYLSELHSLPAVQKNFKVALSGGLKSRYVQHEKRWKIISTVCHMNHVVYSVKCMQEVGKDMKMPPINIDGDDVCPLSDPRIKKKLQKLRLDYWILQEREKEQNLVNNNRNIVRKLNAEHLRHTCILETDIIHVAIDMNNNTYRWVKLEKEKGSADYVQRSYQCSRV